MPLPTQPELSAKILAFVEKQKNQKESAEQSFADGLATIILDVFTSATVIGIEAIVIGTSATGGPVSGTATQTGVGELK